MFWRFKLIHSFHEVSFKRIKDFKRFKIKDWLNEFFMKVQISFCIFKKCKLIFHSENVASVFKTKYKNCLMRVIPFGLFDIFKYTKHKQPIKNDLLKNNYYLFFGYIRDYKGADILVDAIRKLNAQNHVVKVIIAGKNSAKLSQNELPNNIKLIDKYLEDGELSFLVSNCRAVIVPHRKASQSGITNTAYVFNKPVIASDVPGVCDAVYEKTTGLIFKSEDSSDLANKIIELDNNEELYNSMVDNISKRVKMEDIDWVKIATQTVMYYEL